VLAQQLDEAKALLELSARPKRRSQITLEVIILKKKTVFLKNINLLFFPGRFNSIFEKLSV